MSRLTIDVTDQQHQALKAFAALEGKSIRQYVLERLFPSDEQQAMQELKALLQSRLAAAEGGEAMGDAGAEQHRLPLLKAALSSAFAVSEEAYRPVSAGQVIARNSEPAPGEPDESLRS